MTTRDPNGAGDSGGGTRRAPEAPESNGPQATFANILTSEWTKIRTLHSTFWTLLAGAIIVIGFSALWAVAFTGTYDEMTEADRATVTPTAPMQIAFYFGMVVFGVLGVLVITSEYATGMIRTALTAMPRRLEYLAAKALVVAGVVLVIGLIVSFASFYVSQSLLSSKDLNGSLGDEGVLRAVVGGGIYLALIALMGLGIGALLRHTAGAVVTLFMVLFVLGIVGGFLPGEWGRTLNQYLPGNAGGAILMPVQAEGSLAPWTGLGIFALYTAVVLAAAALLFQQRDA